jgi:phosphatidylinositol alpha-1,6-mannosyltransferase
MSSSENYKGHDQVIKSLPSLLTEFPTLVYDVVGDGDGRPALEALAVELGVAHAVRFHGIVSDAVLASLFAAASIYVMPSSGEGFGLAFAEAMAYGKPVIAGNVDAAVEVVRDGETGLLIDPHDVPALVSAISRLLRSDELRREMGLRGAAVVKQDFAFSVFKAKLLALLRDLEPRLVAPHVQGT